METTVRPGAARSAWRRGSRVGGLTVGIIAVVIALATPVAVADAPPLAVDAHDPIAVQITSGSGATVTFTVGSNDPTATVSCDPASGSTFPLGITTVTCTATNATDPPAQGSFTVTVTLVDTTPPVVTVPADIPTTATVASGTGATFSASASDNLDGSITPTCSPASGANFPVGTTTVTCSATDAHGNTGTASFHVTVTLVDTTPPVVTAPADLVREATSGAGAVVTFSATATDNLDGALTPSCAPASGSTFPLGATTVSCSATDAHGNTGTDTFKITIRDTTAPVVTAPADITTTTTATSGKSVTFSASASDNIDGSITPTCSPASGANFPVGTTTVTCSATDTHGNTGTDSFHVTVTLVDTTPPVVTAPADISTTTTVSSGKSVSFSASATDNLDGPRPTTCNPASGANFPVGTTTVTCSATDTHGNTGTDSFHVTVTLVDTTPPVVTAPADITREATSGAGAVVTFSATATDNLDGALTPSCPPGSGSTFPLGATTVTCSATDAHGNTGTDSFKITITDTTSPVVHVPGDITAEATATDGATVSFSASADDTVAGHLSATCDHPSNSTFPVGTTIVKCTATDGRSPEGSATFHVTIGDTTGPSVTVPADLTREANGPAGALVVFTPSATDTVDGPLTPDRITCVPASGSAFPLGKTTVTCTAIDLHVNSGHSSFAVTVVDTTPPRLNIPASFTMTGTSSLPSSDATIAAFLGSANATDLVDGKVPVTNDAPGSFPIGTTTVTFTAVDKKGNKTVASSSVTVTVAVVPPPAPPNTQPPAQVSKLAARAADSAVTLTWLAPADVDFDHVVVEKSSGGAPLSAVYTGSATTYTAKGLTNGVEYRFVVVSYDKAGNASSEAAIVATPAAAMLVQPKDGAVTTKPPTLSWRGVAGASYYNVQLYRVPSTVQTTSGQISGLKVLSIWPTARSLRLSAKWVFAKKTYQLSPGRYRWYVWAGFGPRVEVKYGPLLGQSSFVVRKR
jgi:predicted metallo-beta-lactamase superfamily hydrolase